MKVKVKQAVEEVKAVKYPRLVVYPNGTIVLLHKEFCGICLRGYDVNPAGKYGTD